MILIVFTFLAAFLIEALGTATSVIGLSAMFGSNPIIISLAMALDLGKIVTVTLLYTYWSSLGRLMKTYALIAAAITMIITSAGAAAYLSAEFQAAIQGTQEISLKVDVLKKQQQKYEERKKQIDDQIIKLPEKTTVNQRIRLINAFKAEQKELQEKINEIDKTLPTMQITQIGAETKAGPIVYIAKAFNTSVEATVKYVILLIIIVFDPLAVFLIVAGNSMLSIRRAAKAAAALAEQLPTPQESLPPAPSPVEPPPAVPAPQNTEPVVQDKISYETLDGVNEELRLAKEIRNIDFVAPVETPVETPVVNTVKYLKASRPPLKNTLHKIVSNYLAKHPKVKKVLPIKLEVEPEVELPEQLSLIAAPATTAPESDREEITLDQLRPAPVAQSSLTDVGPNLNDPVIFITDPRTAVSSNYYRNLT